MARTIRPNERIRCTRMPRETINVPISNQMDAFRVQLALRDAATRWITSAQNSGIEFRRVESYRERIRVFMATKQAIFKPSLMK